MVQSTADVEQAARVKPLTLPMAVYLAFLMGMLTLVTAPVGVLVAHVAKWRTADECRISHFRFQIRTFWFGVPILVLGVLLAGSILGYLLITVWAIWSIGRCACGINAVMDGRPIEKPLTLGFGRGLKC